MEDSNNIESISKALEEYQPEFDAVENYSNMIYEEKFKHNFEILRRLRERLGSTSSPITDYELEQILTEIPLELFAASESLNTIRVNKAVLKLKSKERKIMLEDKMLRAAEAEGWTKTEVAKMVSLNTIPDDILGIVLTALIERVESEISIAKELIMGAKKIWDGRKSTSNPVSEVVTGEDTTSLPDYELDGKTYIK